MAIFTNAATLTGSTLNDYVVGDSTATDNTLYGGDGNDYIIGDADTPITMTVMAAAGTGSSSGAPFAINADSGFWSRLYNPDIANSTTVPHATAIIEGNGQFQWFSVTVLGGQVLTLDADYGVGTDLELRLYAADGTTLITSNNNAAALTDGALGSTSLSDSFLTFTAPGSNLTSTTYLIRVGEADTTAVDLNESYTLNMSLTGQGTDTPSEGNDDLYGGLGDDIMYGIGGNDKVYGGAGNDYMTGDDGNDTLDGGAGNDTMYGGNNNDTFVVTNLNNGAGDKIYGGLMTDTLDLSALTGVSNVVVNLATGSFTATGASSITTILEVENVIGTAFNDTITGSALSNTFFGGAGDDSMTGGDGTDKFYGGSGNDTFFTNSSTEHVIEVAAEGTADRVIASSTFNLDAGSAVEFIQTDNAAGTAAINLTGNELAQTITGNAAGNLLDDGAAGASDTLIGGAGNDTYYVHNAGTIIVENAIFNGAVLVTSSDRVASSVSFTLAADDDVEQLTTNSSSGTTAINLTGNALKQSITGNDGDNVLNTGGGGAADAMFGNGGNDTYIVNNSADTISEIAGDGTADRIQAAVSYILNSAADIEFVETTNAVGTGSINLTGSSIGQTLTGNAGANVLDGKLGNDTLVGGAGNDTFAFSTTGGATNTDVITGFVALDDQIELNTAVFTTLTTISGAVNSFGQLNAAAFAANVSGVATSADTRIIYNTSTGALSYDSNGSAVGGTVFQIATLTGAPTILATDINVVVPGSGAAGNVITGTSGNDTAATTGTANADTIYGLAGNDVLTGGLGNDLMYGGTGNDTYVVQGSNDVATEFVGEGTNDVVQTAGSFELTAGSEVEVIQTTNAASVTALNITGNALAQSITGNAGINLLNDGGAGAADTLTGLAGNDVYYVANAGTVIVEVAGGGTGDRVGASVSYVLAAGVDVEQMSTTASLGTTAINLTGNTLAQLITGNAGNNILNTGGGAADTMTGGAGNDTYVVRNAADLINEGVGQGTADQVTAAVSYVLGTGDNIEILATNNAIATAAINLTGNEIAQSVTGNAGNNRLDGKGGIDVLTGGLGNDTFILSSVTGVANADTITDYSVADDQIELGHSIYTTLTPGGTLAAIAFASNTTGVATTADQRIIYNSATGALFYDADGLNGVAGVQIATLATGLAMTASEFTVDGTAPVPGSTINGTSGNDTLVGTVANERINGLGGDDTIGGSAGDDKMFGGAGNDTFIVQNSGDVVTELAGEGTNDVVQASGSFVLTAGSAVEVLQTTNAAGVAAINLTGNALAQSITGNAGANQLNDGAGAGADTLTGLGGNDIYYIGNAGTIINEVAGGGTADRVAASVSFVLAADDDVEQMTTNLSTGTAAINLTGNALAQLITGNAGANILNTGGGAADTLSGLGGNDTYVVRNLADVIIEVAGQGTADRVNASVNFVLDASDDIEILATANDAGVTAQNLTGNAVAQTIIGNAGINTLNDGGGAGADTLIGGAGNDLYLVNNAGTTVIEAVGGGTNDVVRATTSFTLNAGSEVEVIQTANALGITAINFTGNALAQSITGNQGANILNDGATGAADTLTGLDGNDIYVVNNSGTIIVEDASQGLSDEVRASVSFALAADDDIEVLGTTNAAGTTAINLTGNALSQQITGNAGDNVLDSGIGAADTMTGGLGNDTYILRNAGDVVVETSGQGTADEIRVGFSYALQAGVEIEILSTDNAAGSTVLALTGNEFGQTINSNLGANTLIGLGGNDIYTVNNAATVVTEAAAGGTDRVNASVSYTLGAGEEIEVLATTNDAGVVAVTLTGNALDQTIIGNAGASTLIGLGGNDTYTVNNTSTTVTEAAAGGTDTVNASVSYVLTAGSEVEVLQTTSAAGTGAINLTGNAMAQQIIGNAGANTLDSGTGAADTLTGLGGNDIYIQRNAGDVIVETTGNGTADELRVLDANFTLGAGLDIEILSFINASGTSTLNLTGNVLAQIITGNAGINTLNDGGGAGADTLIGLAGADIYLVNNAGTIVTEAAGGGVDTVTASVSFTLSAGSEVETIQTSNAAGTGVINLTGNALAQTITGNAGVNTLNDGGGVADTLVGLAGNDIYVVGNAGTIITETSGNGSDTAQTSVTYTLAAGVDIEFLTTTNAAGTGAINLTGNALAQTITGNAGDNVLNSGGTAVDTLVGLGGNDIYVLNLATDVITETAGNGTADQVQVSFTYTLDAAADVEILATTNAAGSTAINLTGNTLTQAITGNAGINTLSDGGGAADVLTGLAGSDTYLVNNAGTTVIEAAGGGSDVVTATTSFTLSAGSEVETIQTSNASLTTAIDFTGNALAQTITGNAGVNTLNDGGAGAADTLVGLGGNDIYIVSNATTVITEAATFGSDTVLTSVSYVLDVTADIETFGTTSAAGTGTINLTGNTLAQAITGNAGINAISDGGGAGADVLTGLAGNDVYTVGNAGTTVIEAVGGGSDTVISSVTYTLGVGSEVEFLQTSNAAGVGAINFTGNLLSQSITGNAGINTLSDGGAGAADTMTGLGGNDIYVVNNAGTLVVEAATFGADTVQTSVSYVLDAAADIETFTTTNAAGTGAINLTGNGINQSITGNAGVNFIDGKLGNDVLFGGNGVDTFVFSTALNAATNLDTISDFVAIDDTMQLSSAIFSALGGVIAAADFQINATGAATTALANIIYNSSTGGLFYDADGTGAIAGIQFATLTGNPTISLSDFTVV